MRMNLRELSIFFIALAIFGCEFEYREPVGRDAVLRQAFSSLSATKGTVDAYLQSGMTQEELTNLLSRDRLPKSYYGHLLVASNYLTQSEKSQLYSLMNGYQSGIRGSSMPPAGPPGDPSTGSALAGFASWLGSIIDFVGGLIPPVDPPCDVEIEVGSAQCGPPFTVCLIPAPTNPMPCENPNGGLGIHELEQCMRNLGLACNTCDADPLQGLTDVQEAGHDFLCGMTGDTGQCVDVDGNIHDFDWGTCS